ncbi:hypothetical protein C8D90_101845 [Enterobacillus tribolii]|uniref:Uncharacterized protein n=1 Tax=Enterobacillus tribolii TaxID=1487935 RepID=A0A370R4P9_9GAMM|nr:hypothetical protein C8D90_101845 [Enterobacillus tribolii]
MTVFILYLFSAAVQMPDYYIFYSYPAGIKHNYRERFVIPFASAGR